MKSRNAAACALPAKSSEAASSARINGGVASLTAEEISAAYAIGQSETRNVEKFHRLEYHAVAAFWRKCCSGAQKCLMPLFITAGKSGLLESA